MFARTERLTLRPGWIEDAPELACAIADERVARNLSRVPWPYTVEDARAFLALPTRIDAASCLVFAHREGSVRLIGGMGFGPRGEEPYEFGYWLTPDAWGQGFATEAGTAVVAMARALRVPRLVAGHFVDNPASARVLHKLGFRPTGRVRPTHSLGRGSAVPSVRHELRLDLPAEPAEAPPCQPSLMAA